MANLDIAKEIGTLVGETVPTITHDELVQTISNDLVGNNAIYIQLCGEIDSFLRRVENWERHYGTIGQRVAVGSFYSEREKLTSEKNLIYNQFFRIQNLINAYKGQKVVMTYVHIDESGHREIRISENDIEHIQVTQPVAWKPSLTLSYVVDHHYHLLKQSIPPDEKSNIIQLDQTVEEIDRRYNKYSYAGRLHVVLWYPGEWHGAKMYTKGPINEAYVNMYLHNIQLLNSLEENIDIFMFGDHGAIKADATKGFMIGDIAKDGIQYAVKGSGGSPQGVRDVIESFKEFRNKSFSPAAFQDLINKYTIEEERKHYKPQITKYTTESLKSLEGDINNISKRKLAVVLGLS